MLGKTPAWIEETVAKYLKMVIEDSPEEPYKFFDSV